MYSRAQAGPQTLVVERKRALSLGESCLDPESWRLLSLIQLVLSRACSRAVVRQQNHSLGLRWSLDTQLQNKLTPSAAVHFSTQYAYSLKSTLAQSAVTRILK